MGDDALGASNLPSQDRSSVVAPIVADNNEEKIAKEVQRMVVCLPQAGRQNEDGGSRASEQTVARSIADGCG